MQRGDDPALVPDRAPGALPDVTRVVEEKLDGANAAISFGGASTRRLQSRGHFPDVDGRPSRERHLSTFETWARMHEPALLARLEDRHTVYGARATGLRATDHRRRRAPARPAHRAGRLRPGHRVPRPDDRAGRAAERGRDVPDKALAGMLGSWDPPTFDEALEIEGHPPRIGSGGR